MKILNRVPYGVERQTLVFGRSQIPIKQYQIVVWVSLCPPEFTDWDSRTPAMPVILDPGNNHNFSIRESQLIRLFGDANDAMNS